MELEPFFKLLNNNEKSILKSILISFPCFYTLITLYFPEFLNINIFGEIIIALGITVIMAGIIYFQISFIDDASEKIIFGMLTSQLIFMNFFAILIGSLSGFHITTIYAILLTIGFSYIFSIIRSIIRRKKSFKKQ
jgi:hypothetical protein